ncbi:hypothetical protein K474DRAFT_617368 [Panus rudis PR-1116 ss-1]|nr:hypothetical protein K474DRAFT_617368 [Panus rudis PR-1116 ss-1]
MSLLGEPGDDWKTAWRNVYTLVPYYFSPTGTVEEDGYYDVPEWVLDLTAAMGGHWKPLFQKSPKNAARILTKLRVAERDVPPTQQWLFLVDFLEWYDNSSTSHQDRLEVLESGLSTVLTSILLDQEIYELLYEYPVITNLHRFVGIILLLLCLLGDDITPYLYSWPKVDCECEAHSQPASDNLHRVVKSTLEQLPALWELFWQKPSIFLDEGDMHWLKLHTEKLERKFAVNISMVVQATTWCRLSAAYNNRRVLESQLDHIYRSLLYTWTRWTYQDHPQFRFVLQALMRYIVHIGAIMPPAKQEDAVRDVFRVVATTQNPPRQIVYTIHRILTLGAEGTILDGDLARAFHIFNLVCRCTPDIVQYQEDIDSGADLLTAMSKACHRQICSGKADFTANISVVTVSILT